MRCPNCGEENDNRSLTCLSCGYDLRPRRMPVAQAPAQQMPVQQRPAYAPNQIYNEAYAVCPRCGGKMLPQTVSEMKKRNILTILLWIFLTLCSAGIIPLIAIIRGRKSKTRTYMVCQRCGYRVDSRKLKNWK